MGSALEGIRILDLSRLAPGPYCTMILADLGAEVIRIEEPGGGRRMQIEDGVYKPDEQEIRRRTLFHPHNRNKKSIALNLKEEAAKKILYRLVEKADALVEGFRPGVVKRLKVDYETLRVMNSGLIYCSISGYGQDGPYRDLVGHDINYVSIAGALGIVGNREDGRPAIPSNLLADYAGGGMQAALGILAAIIARQRTGKGQYIDVAMADGVVSLLAIEAMNYFAFGQIAKPSGTRLNGAVPYYNVYETSDGRWISVGSNEPWFYENLCRALGKEEFIGYQYSTGRKREEIFEAFRQIFKTKTRDEWFNQLSQHDICVSPVYSMDEVFSDPQVIHRKMVLELDDPQVGKVRQVGVCPRLSDTPGKVYSLGPFPGQHTGEILEDLGYSVSDIEKLREQNVVA